MNNIRWWWLLIAFFFGGILPYMQKDLFEERPPSISDLSYQVDVLSKSSQDQIEMLAKTQGELKDKMETLGRILERNKKRLTAEGPD